jgi:hypothetical protein
MIVSFIDEINTVAIPYFVNTVPASLKTVKEMFKASKGYK